MKFLLSSKERLDQGYDRLMVAVNRLSYIQRPQLVYIRSFIAGASDTTIYYGDHMLLSLDPSAIYCHELAHILLKHSDIKRDLIGKHNDKDLKRRLIWACEVGADLLGAQLYVKEELGTIADYRDTLFPFRRANDSTHPSHESLFLSTDIADKKGLFSLEFKKKDFQTIFDAKEF